MNSSRFEKLVLWAAASGGAAALAYIFIGPKGAAEERGLTRGLQNLGNTCFMNAILQALAANRCFVSWMNEMIANLPPTLQNFMPMSMGVHEVLCALSSHETKSVHCPAGMLTALASHGWQTGGCAQDAHELFHIVMMALVHELNVWQEPMSLLETGIVLGLPSRELPPRVKINAHNVESLPFRFSVRCKPLDGLLVNKMKCCRCFNERPLHYSHFDSLSLSLPRSYWTTNFSVPLPSMLRSFCHPEVLEDVECDSCARLVQDFSVSGPAKTPSLAPRANFTKTVQLGRVPQCLCLHIQRLYWLENGMSWKSQAKVSCPEVLNMAPYIHSSVGASLAGSSPEKGSRKALLYRLKSIVVHLGGSAGGHYVTYRCGLDDHTKWCCVSDTSVRDITSSEARTCAAYMIFYERIPP